jgi:hypothetical protein
MSKQTAVFKVNFPSIIFAVNEIDPILKNSEDEKIQSIIQWLEDVFNTKRTSFTNELLQRHCEIVNMETFVSLQPIHDESGKLEYFYDSIRNAMMCYCYKQFTSSLILTGVAAEMLTMIIYEINTPTLKREKLNSENEKEIFGREFIKLPHSRRLEILKAFDIIKNSDFEKLKNISKLRNKLVHDFKHYLNVEAEAARSFIELMIIFKNMINIEYNGETIKLDPQFLEWLKK